MITPSDTPASPSDYAAVTPHGRGTAPYDVQASSDEAAITSAFNGANAVAGSGVLYPMGPRQRDTESLLSSAQGYGEFDIIPGFTGGGEWPGNVEPGA